MARAIAEVSLEDFNESVNIMVHSWPGQGKTVWGANAPNCTLVSCEPGTVSAKRRGSTAGLVRIPDWETAVDLLHAVEAGDFKHRDWLVIDTLSTLQQRNMNAILDKAVAENSRRDPDIPAIQDYQKNQNSLKRWVERMVDAPINCIFLCHTMRVEDHDGSAMFLPSIMGGPDKGFPVANYIMGLMNVVGYMEKREIGKGEGKQQVRRILWQPYHNAEKDVRYTAKDQFDCLGMWSDDSTAAEIISLIEKSGVSSKEEKPPTRRVRQ